MQGVDEVFGYEAGAEKYREIAQAGMEQMRTGLKPGRANAPGVGGHGESQGTATGEKE